MDEKEMKEVYYVNTNKPRHKVYIAMLVVIIISVVAFTLFSTESGIDNIAKKYPDRLKITSDADSENVAYAMQQLFLETGLILDDTSASAP